MRIVGMILAVLMIIVGLGTVVSAADYEVPAFLVVGKTYMIFPVGAPVTVLDIDWQTCWMKTNSLKGGEEIWVN